MADATHIEWTDATWNPITGCCEDYEARRKAILSRRPELRGKNLACWCRPDQPCHADVLLELANRDPEVTP